MLRLFAGFSSHRDWGIVTNFEADVSVVIPVYNEEKRVRTAVERVLRLSFVKEVIVVDDGSTDNSRKVLSELSDPRLRVI